MQYFTDYQRVIAISETKSGEINTKSFSKETPVLEIIERAGMYCKNLTLNIDGNGANLDDFRSTVK